MDYGTLDLILVIDDSPEQSEFFRKGFSMV